MLGLNTFDTSSPTCPYNLRVCYVNYYSLSDKNLDIIQFVNGTYKEDIPD